MRPVVLLYNPRTEYWTMPLGLLAVASALDLARVEPVIVDGRFGVTADRAVAALRGRTVLCAGLSVLSGRPIADALAFTQRFRALRPGVPVVWGGWHASIRAAQVLEHGAIDAVVVGQGQLTFRELVDGLLDGNGLVAVEGAGIRERGQPKMGPERPFVSPADLAPVDYSLLDLEPYFAAGGRRLVDYSSSQGCPFRCAFCSDPLVYGRSWHGLPAEQVLAEIDALTRRYRLDTIAFQDDLFFVQRRRSNEILAGLAARRPILRWSATARASHVARMSQDELRLLAESGCHRILVGAESGSQAVLDRLTKDQDADALLECAVRLHRLGIAASYSFIAGAPGERAEDLEETLRLVERIKAANPRVETRLFPFAPYPGSDLVTELERSGAPLPRTLEEWARCDGFSAGVAALTPAQSRLVERFDYYARHGYEPRGGDLAHKALYRVARARMKRRFFAAPVEMHAARAWRRVAQAVRGRLVGAFPR